MSYTHCNIGRLSLSLFQYTLLAFCVTKFGPFMPNSKWSWHLQNETIPILWSSSSHYFQPLYVQYARNCIPGISDQNRGPLLPFILLCWSANGTRAMMRKLPSIHRWRYFDAFACSSLAALNDTFGNKVLLQKSGCWAGLNLENAFLPFWTFIFFSWHVQFQF